MAELREVFEMTTKQIEPDLDSWRKQEERQHRGARRRKIGALAVAAVTAVVAAIGIVWTLDTDDGAQERTPAAVGVSADLGPWTYLVDLPTGQATKLDGLGSLTDTDVSPDGATLTQGEQMITVVDLDGSNLRKFDRTLETGEGVNAPHWSPDGRTIVYQADGPREGLGNLFVVDVASGKVTQLTDLDQLGSHLWYMSPSFSPDGRSVLFTSPRGPCASCDPSNGDADRQLWHLWSVPSSGGEPTVVVHDAGFGEYSPDGSLITYTQISGDGEFGDLWIANADGSERRRLATGELVFPRWSPDGTRIAYADQGSDATLVVDVETGARTEIADELFWPEWVDDDTLLLPFD
jgi:Tol biopolymer transport system component